MASAAVTHPGRVRTSNEDSVLVTERIVAVADGMGGHAAGEVASRIAVERMDGLGALDVLRPDDVTHAIDDANRLICRAAGENPDRSGMGTTLTGVGLVTVGGTEHCMVFNVGDSRVYSYRDGELHQVSVDHSEVQELRAAGRLSEQDAESYPRRNVITRCLGTDPPPRPDLWVFPPTGGDRFVVCSDGLSNEVPDRLIRQVLDDHIDPGDAAATLLDHALEAGGRDNVAVVVVNLDVRGDGNADVGALDSDTAPRRRLAPGR